MFIGTDCKKHGVIIFDHKFSKHLYYIMQYIWILFLVILPAVIPSIPEKLTIRN